MTNQRGLFSRKDPAFFFIPVIVALAAGQPADKVYGSLVHFYHNGTWSRFEDERIVAGG